MGSVRTFIVAMSAILVSGASAVGAQEEPQPVLVYDYAVSHPVEDAAFSGSPSIGASVPHTVTVATVEDTSDSVYGYFYHQGRPVIVDMSTRSIVRVGN